MVDCFSKGCKLIPFSSLPSALQVAKLLFQHVFRCYNIPEEILPDHGPKFIFRVCKVFFKKLGIAVSLSSDYHPEINGQAERSIQELGRLLGTYYSSRQHEWACYLVWEEYAQNSIWDDTPMDIPAVDEW